MYLAVAGIAPLQERGPHKFLVLEQLLQLLFPTFLCFGTILKITDLESSMKHMLVVKKLRKNDRQQLTRLLFPKLFGATSRAAWSTATFPN
jgi:hypothetical protein